MWHILLWIAFKNYYLRDTKQPRRFKQGVVHGCELLSKIIIFVTRNNIFEFCIVCNQVVNCFQKLLSSWHETTAEHLRPRSGLLWIAFKNYYLRDTKQLLNSAYRSPACCELLSKIIIFVTRNNVKSLEVFIYNVVNCFQKLLSSWHETTKITDYNIYRLLWIAFKNYYLRDTKQQRTIPQQPKNCCELLSKIIIFVTRNNSVCVIFISSLVVNCFQKLLSSWHETTTPLQKLKRKRLWIAFKNYYLRDTTQLYQL